MTALRPVVCEPPVAGGVDAADAPEGVLVVVRLDGDADPWAGGRTAALARARQPLVAPRTLRWSGAVHDVPLQWPAVVAGLVRAAGEEVSLQCSGEGAGT